MASVMAVSAARGAAPRGLPALPATRKLSARASPSAGSVNLRPLAAARLRTSRPRQSVQAVAVPASPAGAGSGTIENLPLPPELSDVLMSGLNGKALRQPPIPELPTKAQVLAAIPEHCFKKDTAKSLMYAAISAALTIAPVVLAAKYLPLQMAYLPAWIAYACITGTLATGMWVVAHECGHGAFSDNRFIQDAVGYVYHSLLLVPYFSWQRSHAVHHARTNHLTEGETHCPYTEDSRSGKMNIAVLNAVGRFGYTVVQLVTHLLVGWPAYILWGATGGPSRGVTNHFWPTAPFSEALWPGSWKGKVLKSDIGILATLAGLAFWASQTSVGTVLALYAAPYLVTNAWLVLYTWLQHTDTDIPHYDGSDWNFVRGAFLTVDRPYGALMDFVHHRIGSTHVAHHVDSSIPHYHAVEATEALKKAFPHLYLYDPTPIIPALIRVAARCVTVSKRGDKYVFV